MLITVGVFFFWGTWSWKNVHPQEWQAPLSWRQKYHLLCSSQTGAHGHHCWECIQVCFIRPSKAFSRPFAQMPTVCNAVILHCTPFSEDKMHSSRDFHILFVPRRSMLCEQRLKEQGVLGSFINIDEYILDLIPFDGDLLSMEYESAFRVCSTCISQTCTSTSLLLYDCVNNVLL